MKLKRLAAFAAAVLMTCSMFAGCGKKTDNDEEADVSINIISDGSTVETDEWGNTSAVTTEFDDPAAALGITTPSMDEDGNVERETTTEPSSTVAQSDVEAVMQQTTAPKQALVKDYNIDCTTRYGYNQLNDAEKKLYKQILEAASAVKLKVAVDDSVSDEMWIKVYGCVYMQEPQLFWLTSKKVQKGKLWYWEVDTDVINDMQAKVQAKASDVVASASGKSTYDKLKTFHDYIVLHNNFEKSEGFNQTVYGGLVGGTVQCEGYAKTMQYLCDMAGIESTVIVGTNESGDSHAWNVVKVDGEWYNLDCTWDDPILSVVDTTNIRYNYFLVPDEWIHNKSHFNVNQKTTGTKVTYFTAPKCTSDKMNYFAQTGKLYKDASSADTAIKDAMKAAASGKMRVAEIRVASADVYNKVTANLKDYANWIKAENSSVTKVTSNCDPNTLIIELDLIY